MKLNRLLPSVVFLIVVATAFSEGRAENIEALWEAEWISPSKSAHVEYGVFVFKKEIEIDHRPDQKMIKISADNRYRLFVNGQVVSTGPSRGDFMHWRYDSLDLAPYLQAGKNQIVVQIWNFGAYRPGAQLTRETALVVEGDDDIRTNRSWKAAQIHAYEPLPIDLGKLNTFMISGHGVKINGSRMPWGWESGNEELLEWGSVHSLGSAYPHGRGTQGKWLLVPNEIPRMEEIPQSFNRIREFDDSSLNETEIRGELKLSLPANSKETFLLDNGVLTTAYPIIRTTGGDEAVIRITYAESLYEKERGNDKGNRDEVAGKFMRGVVDEIHPDGSTNREYRPLRFRTFRYALVEIETKSDPLVIDNISSVFTGYPLKERASFSTSMPVLDEIWETGWRTQRLCANDIFYDCPYYEQMMYVGDTRIQALITQYVSGDARLTRKSIDLFQHSQSYEGLTASSVPSDGSQFIPPFSLFWILMVHDYFMHNDDETFVESKLNSVRSVLAWFDSNLDAATGLYSAQKWWNFVDWANEWPWDNAKRIGGIPHLGENEVSSIITLQWIQALRASEELFEFYQKPHLARQYRKKADQLLTSVYESCWCAEKDLIASAPDRKEFTQHANLLWILVSKDGQFGISHIDLMEQVLRDDSLVQCTFYFRFYLHEALLKAGLGDDYLSLLGPWESMLDKGLSTFCETPDPTRSDCHAWSSSPNYHFLKIECGITPKTNGFKSLKIEPHLGDLPYVKGKMPHPDGMIDVYFKKTSTGKIEGWVLLPDSLTAELVVNNSQFHVRGGKRFNIPSW